jgi:hypothetical protein
MQYNLVLKLPKATVKNHTTGAEYMLETARGATEFRVLLVRFEGTLEPNCRYTITIPANSVYAEDGSVCAKEIVLTFTTAKELGY